MAPQHNSRDDGGSHELDDSNTESSSSRVRVADAGLRRSIESSSSSNNSTEEASTTTSQDKNYGQRRPRRKGRAADDVVRLSATFTRRHSSSPEPPEKEPSPPPPPDESSSSGDATNNNKAAAAAAAIRRRKKCRPRHRCPTTNESISSILKPYPKYLPSGSILQSFSSEAAGGGDNDNHHISSSHTSTSSSSAKPSLRRRSWNCTTQTEPSIPAASMHSFFLPPLNGGKPLGKSQKRPSCDSLDQQWVPNGVDFSSSVEVHVFHVKWWGGVC